MNTGFPKSFISCSESESGSSDFHILKRHQSIQEFEAVGECNDIVIPDAESNQEEDALEAELNGINSENLLRILNQEKTQNQSILSLKQELNQTLHQEELYFIQKSNILEENQRRIHQEKLQCQFRSNEISGQNLLLEEFRKVIKIDVLDFKEELKKCDNELASQEADFLKERLRIMQESNSLNQTINKLKNEIKARQSMIQRFKNQKMITVQNEVIDELKRLRETVVPKKQSTLYQLQEAIQSKKTHVKTLQKSIKQLKLNNTSSSDQNLITIPNPILSLIKTNQELINYLKSLLYKIISLPNFEELLNQDYHLKSHLNGFPCYIVDQFSSPIKNLNYSKAHLNSKLHFFGFFIKNFKKFKKTFSV